MPSQDVECPCFSACEPVRNSTTDTGWRIAAAAVTAVAIADNSAVVILVTISTGGGVRLPRRTCQLKLQLIFFLVPPLLLLFMLVRFVHLCGLPREHTTPQIGGGIEEAIQSANREA